MFQHTRQIGAGETIGDEQRDDDHQGQAGQAPGQLQDQQDAGDRRIHVVRVWEHLGTHAQEFGVGNDVGAYHQGGNGQQRVGMAQPAAIADRRQPGGDDGEYRAGQERIAEGGEHHVRLRAGGDALVGDDGIGDLHQGREDRHRGRYQQ